MVTGLTVPTDIVLDERGRTNVLEFCDEFLHPLKTRAQMWEGPSHGGQLFDVRYHHSRGQSIEWYVLFVRGTVIARMRSQQRPSVL